MRSSNQIESENRRAGSLARLGHLLDVKYNDLLETFRDFQLVDLQRSKKTAYEKVYYIRKFLAQLDKRLGDVTREDIRGYLKKLKGSSATYKNTLAALKVFFRDFLDMPHVVETFRFPRESFKPKHARIVESIMFYVLLSSLSVWYMVGAIEHISKRGALFLCVIYILFILQQVGISVLSSKLAHAKPA